MKTVLQRLCELVKWDNVELKTTIISMQSTEKQQIIDAYAHGYLQALLAGETTNRTIDEMANEYYDIFFEPQNLSNDD